MVRRLSVLFLVGLGLAVVAYVGVPMIRPRPTAPARIEAPAAPSLSPQPGGEVRNAETRLATSVKPRKGRTNDFTDPSGNADRLFVFHRDVDKARERLRKGDPASPARSEGSTRH